MKLNNQIVLTKLSEDYAAEPVGEIAVSRTRHKF